MITCDRRGNSPAALVFGNTGGAIIGLTLAALHPACLAGQIAHESPAVSVLPADDPERAFFADRYTRGGAPAAGCRFREAVRGEGAYRWPDDLWRRFLGNQDHLFGTEWAAFASFRPDEDALKSAPFPIVLGAGAEGRDTCPSVEIARRIGAPGVEFPGIRMEFLRRPDRFAAALRALATWAYADGRPAEPRMP